MHRAALLLLALGCSEAPTPAAEEPAEEIEVEPSEPNPRIDEPRSELNAARPAPAASTDEGAQQHDAFANGSVGGVQQDTVEESTEPVAAANAQDEGRSPMLSAFLVPTSAPRAENGQGEEVESVDAVAVRFRGLPTGGSDPVLRVGSLRFTRYSYPSPGVLEFVAADRSALQGAWGLELRGHRFRVRVR